MEEEVKINRTPFDILQSYIDKYQDEESGNDKNMISIPLNDFMEWYNYIDDESQKIVNLIKPDFVNYQVRSNLGLLTLRWSNLFYLFVREIVGVKKTMIENSYNILYHINITNRKEHEYAMISFDKEKNESWKKIEEIQRDIMKQIELIEATHTRA